LKARNGWTDKSFIELLELLKEMLLEKKNTLPNRNYELKNSMSNGFGVQEDTCMPK